MENPTIYYWESESDCGQFMAASDENALHLLPENCLCLYKESDSPDGLPFIFIYERNQTNE